MTDRTGRPGLWLGLLVIVAMAVLSLWASGRLPAGDSIPVTFGDLGASTATRFQVLWLVPLIGLGAVGVFSILPKFDSKRIPLMGKTYVALTAVMLLLLAGAHAVIVFSAMGRAVNTTTIVLVLVGVLFIVVGSFLPRLQRNQSMGLRTPWTMASDGVWTRTHRFAGRLFVALGVVMMFGVFIDSTAVILVIVVGGSIGTFLLSLIFSFVAWRAEQRG